MLMTALFSAWGGGVIYPDFSLYLTEFFTGKHLIQVLADKMHNFRNFAAVEKVRSIQGENSVGSPEGSSEPHSHCLYEAHLFYHWAALFVVGYLNSRFDLLESKNNWPGK